MTNKNKPRSDLQEAKQRAREIRSTYPFRSHSGNVQMNVVGVVVLASPPRDLIQSKRHNGWRLRSVAMTPPPRSSKAWWSGRWDQQHDGVVFVMESICRQGFAYAREVEEDRQISSQTRARKYYKRQRRRRLKQFSVLGQNLKQSSIRFFYIRPRGRGLENGFHKTLSPKYYTCMSR
jgi:hypothetical protein